jgi:hypothetical protein
MTEKTHWIITPEEDLETGDLIITFPLDLLERAGWKEGDTLVWNITEDGFAHLTKKAV